MYRTTFFAASIAATIAVSLPAASPVVAQTAPLVQDAAEVRSGTYLLDPAHGKITWSVNHLGFSTYSGQFTDVAATLELDAKRPDTSRLSAEIKIASIASLNPALDKHLASADFFDVAAFPVARFEASQIRLTGKGTAEIKGMLTMKGVTRPVTMTAVFNQVGTNPVDKKYSVGFDGEAKIKRSEFGVSYGVPYLGDEVTLHLEAEFKLQDSAAVAPGREPR